MARCLQMQRRSAWPIGTSHCEIRRPRRIDEQGGFAADGDSVRLTVQDQEVPTM